MHKLQILLAAPLLKYALDKRSPRAIPRSGAEGAAVNCFSVHIDKDSQPHLMMTGLDGGQASFLEWDGSSFSRPYSTKWFLHPARETHERKVALYLDSLAESGDLKKQGYKYEVTGKAIQTIERYEEEEARHVEHVRMQRLMAILTLVIVALTVVQAGIVRLPALLDLSR